LLPQEEGAELRRGREKTIGERVNWKGVLPRGEKKANQAERGRLGKKSLFFRRTGANPGGGKGPLQLR